MVEIPEILANQETRPTQPAVQITDMQRAFNDTVDQMLTRKINLPFPQNVKIDVATQEKISIEAPALSGCTVLHLLLSNNGRRKLISIHRPTQDNALECLQTELTNEIYDETEIHFCTPDKKDDFLEKLKSILKTDKLNGTATYYQRKYTNNNGKKCLASGKYTLNIDNKSNIQTKYESEAPQATNESL